MSVWGLILVYGFLIEWGFTGFLRFDFDEGLVTLMDFWGLILVYGFLIFFFFGNEFMGFTLNGV